MVVGKQAPEAVFLRRTRGSYQREFAANDMKTLKMVRSVNTGPRQHWVQGEIPHLMDRNLRNGWIRLYLVKMGKGGV